MSRRRILALPLVLVLVGAGALACDPDPACEPAGVDPEVAAMVEDLDLTLYDVRLDDAEVTEARADDVEVVLRYEHAGEFRYTVVVEQAPTGDLCRANGYGPDGTDPQGGSCTSSGDRMTTEFEEMGSASLRRGTTLVSVSNLIIEMDDGLQDRALDALAAAEPLSVDDLGRLLGPG